MISDPVLWYTMDDADISGSTVTDRGSGGNTGTLVGGPTSTAGKVREGRSFNGSGQYVNCGAPASLNLHTANAFTLAAWVYPTSAPTGSGAIATTYPNYVNYEIGWAILTGSDSVLEAGIYDGSWHTIRDSVSASLNAWTHIAVTWDGYTLSLYKNGSNVASQTLLGVSIPTSYTGTIIGRRHDTVGSQPYFPGKIDEARIYNRALSFSEIADLYAWRGWSVRSRCARQIGGI